jgi:hypothetical protein
MSQEGGVGVSCKLITEGGVGYVGLGQVGSRGQLWLADGDGGECERGTGGWLACLVRHAAASLLLFFLYCTRFACILSSSFQTLQDKGERVLLQ